MTEAPEEDHELSFLEHLVELRGRLLKACLSVVVVLIALLPFSRHLYETLAAPMIAQLPEGSTTSTTLRSRSATPSREVQPTSLTGIE